MTRVESPLMAAAKCSDTHDSCRSRNPVRRERPIRRQRSDRRFDDAAVPDILGGHRKAVVQFAAEQVGADGPRGKLPVGGTLAGVGFFEFFQLLGELLFGVVPQLVFVGSRAHGFLSGKVLVKGLAGPYGRGQKVVPGSAEGGPVFSVGPALKQYHPARKPGSAKRWPR